MTNQVTPARTTGELYPPPSSPELRKFLADIVVGTDENRNHELRRPLHGGERAALEQRRDGLARWLVPAGSRRQVALAVMTMLAGFGKKDASKEDALGRATVYAVALQGLPLWCVERACMKFSTGHVNPEELGDDQRVDLAFGPSTAQLRRVAEGLLRPVAEERTRISKTLRGTVPMATESGEERRAAGERMLQDVEAMKARQKELAEAEREKLLKRDAESERRRVESVLAEYDRMGLEQPKLEDGKALVSPQLCLAMGWRIEEVEGRRRLTRPASFASALPEWEHDATRGARGGEDYWRRPGEGMPR